MQIFAKLLSVLRKKLVISSIGVVALVVFSSWILFEATKAEVVITENNEEMVVKTHTNTVGELLDDVGITVGKHDDLSQKINVKIKNGMEIKYKKAKQIVVTIDGDEQDFYTTKDTIEDFFLDEKLTFSVHDEVSHETDNLIKDGLHIKVATAYQVIINDGGKEKKVWTTGGTVKDLLQTNNITYKKVDKVKPAIKEDVTKETTIMIVHVEKTTETSVEKVAFETEKQKDSSLAKGEKQVISQGQEGTVIKKYEVTLENGEEVNRELVNTEIEEESKKHVVAIGTKEVKQSVAVATSESKSNNNSNSKVFHMTASAYTASCSGCSGYTATGIDLKANPNMKVIAVDPNVIPLGSKVWVEGYGTAIAGDTGGSIKGKRIDAHFPTKADAYSFGRKKVKVKIID